MAFHSLGCKVNSVETEAMQEAMLRHGFDVVPFDTAADIYVVNTCSVTNIADRKSRQMLHRAKALNPKAVIVAAGCYAQAAGETLLKEDVVDIVIGNTQKNRLPELVEAYFDRQQAVSAVEDISGERCFEEMSHEGSSSDRARAFIKIEDGCNQFCTYCLIPHVRGRVRSRSQASVLEEARKLTEAGFKEIVLTGIHVSSYGIDLPGDAGDSRRYGEPLVELLTELNALPGLERIRLSSLEPRVITESSAKTLSKLEHLCPHFHLSLQSGSDSVLKRMGRRYRAEEFYEEMRRLREAFGTPALTTDVIVGFPGETEEEFEETVAFLEKAKFYETHVFRYSRRKGTPADRMSDQVPEPVKAERSARLLALNKINKAAFEQRLIGQERAVLLEQPVPGKAGIWTGFTPEYVRLNIKTPYGEAGQIQKVIVEAEMLS